MTRSQARKNAFSIIFQQPVNDFTKDEITEIAETFELELDDFAYSLIVYTIDNLEEFDKNILSCLSAGWKLSRIGKSSLSILRLSCAQFKFFPDIPTAAIINESVELSKEFGDAKDYSFVNGVLRSLSKIYREEAEV